MTQSLKQMAELIANKMKIRYDKGGVVVEVTGTVKIKETDTWVEFNWTTSSSASTLVITNEVCVDNYFKNALRNILIGYVSGLLHYTKIIYNYRTNKNGQLEK